VLTVNSLASLITARLYILISFGGGFAINSFVAG
jgi:hypothetical protein